MDLFIAIRKLDAGNWIPMNVLGEPHPGAWGKMRVSRRALDEKLSTHFQPIQAHRKDEKPKPGEIVPVDIEIWPHSRIWHKGQRCKPSCQGTTFAKAGSSPSHGNLIIKATT
jgi:predicted acyl esterase